MALQPVTFRPITEIKPVTRRAEEPVRKAAERKPRRGRKPDPGTGENLDTWV